MIAWSEIERFWSEHDQLIMPWIMWFVPGPFKDALYIKFCIVFMFNEGCSSVLTIHIEYFESTHTLIQLIVQSCAFMSQSQAYNVASRVNVQSILNVWNRDKIYWAFHWHILPCDLKPYLVKYFRIKHFWLNYHHKALLTPPKASSEHDMNVFIRFCQWSTGNQIRRISVLQFLLR